MFDGLSPQRQHGTAVQAARDRSRLRHRDSTGTQIILKMMRIRACGFDCGNLQAVLANYAESGRRGQASRRDGPPHQAGGGPRPKSPGRPPRTFDGSIGWAERMRLDGPGPTAPPGLSGVADVGILWNTSCLFPIRRRVWSRSADASLRIASELSRQSFGRAGAYGAVSWSTSSGSRTRRSGEICSSSP